MRGYKKIERGRGKGQRIGGGEGEGGGSQCFDPYPSRLQAIIGPAVFAGSGAAEMDVGITKQDLAVSLSTLRVHTPKGWELGILKGTATRDFSHPEKKQHQLALKC